MLHGSSRLGLSDLGGLLNVRSEKFQEMRDLKETRGAKGSDRELERYASIIQSLTLPMIRNQVVDPPEIPASLLTPGRRADHDFASAIFVSTLAVLLFVTAMGVLLFRLRTPAGMGKLARRFSDLFDLRDWSWIIGGGVLMPFIFIYIVTWLTPMGGRSWGFRPMGFVFPGVHFLILFLLLLSIPPLVVRWRMSARLAAFGMKERASAWRMLLPLIGVIVALTAFPLMAGKLLVGPYRLMVFGLLVLWALSIFSIAIVSLFGRNKHRFRKAITARLLLPAYASAIIVAAGSLPFIVASAERWSSKDKLSRAVPQGLSFMEAEIAAQKRMEVNAVLGFEK